MFDIDPLTYNPEVPSFYVILITSLFAFLLSSLISITYELTTQSLYKKAHFLQSLAMISVVAATVMQAIGDSVGRGLGMLGALSIIRFRTTLTDPRNMTFMFASLAAGIACGVLGYGIALTGTLVFCLAAILLYFSPLRDNNEIIGDVKIHALSGEKMRVYIEKLYKKYCIHYELRQLNYLGPKSIKVMNGDGLEIKEKQSRDHLQEYTYAFRLAKTEYLNSLNDCLKASEGIEEVKINLNKRNTLL